MTFLVNITFVSWFIDFLCIHRYFIYIVLSFLTAVIFLFNRKMSYAVIYIIVKCHDHFCLMIHGLVKFLFIWIFIYILMSFVTVLIFLHDQKCPIQSYIFTFTYILQYWNIERSSHWKLFFYRFNMIKMSKCLQYRTNCCDVNWTN